MAKRKFSEYDHVPIHWLPELRDSNDLLLEGFDLGYRIDRDCTAGSDGCKYTLYKARPHKKAQMLGTFDTAQEVTDFLRFLLATAEKEN